MDALSHVLISFILGQALQLDGNLQLLLIVSSISLDVDAISIRSPEAAFRFHRGPVHSILAALVASALISAGYAVFMHLPTTALLSVVLICHIGVFSHLILDLPATGNMAALWPLSKRNLAFNLTYYIDPTTLGALATAALLMIYARTDISTSRIVAGAAIAFLILSFGARCYMKNAATKIIRALDANVSSEILSLPTHRPDRWWAFRRTRFENGYRYDAYQVYSIRNKILNKGTIESPYISYSGPVEPPIDSPQKAAACSKKDKRVSNSIEKFTLPAVDVTFSDDRETWQVFWYDAFTYANKEERQGILVNVRINGTITVNARWAHETQLPNGLSHKSS